MNFEDKFKKIDTDNDFGQEEYEDIKKMEIDFSEANSPEELFNLFDEMGGLQDDDKFYSSEELKEIAKDVLNFIVGSEKLPNVGGLRQKVGLLAIDKAGAGGGKETKEQAVIAKESGDAESEKDGSDELKKINAGNNLEQEESEDIKKTEEPRPKEKELKHNFSKVQNWENLFGLVEKNNGVQGGGKFYSPEEFKEIINNIRSGKASPSDLTIFGLVDDLLDEIDGLQGRDLDSAGILGKEDDVAVSFNPDSLEDIAESEEESAPDSAEEFESKEEEKKEGEAFSIWEDFGLNEQGLEKNIEGFNELSKGQRLLVLENFRQVTLGRIERESLQEQRKLMKGFDKRKAKNFWDVKGGLADVKGYSKTLSNNLWQGLSKNFKISGFNKIKIENIKENAMETHEPILQELVNGLKEFGPEVVEREDGELEFHYVNPEEFEEKDRGEVEAFNEASYEFSRIPHKWSLKGASRSEREKYKESKERYDEAKENILNLKSKVDGDKEAALYLNGIEEKITINQYLNSNPDVEEHLKNIKDKKAWEIALKGTVTERGFYFGLGAATRTATAGMLKLAGASLMTSGIGMGVAAVGLGGAIAKRRAEKARVESAALSRADDQSEVRGIEYGETMRGAALLRREITELNKKIDLSDDSVIAPKEKNDLVNKLKEKEDELKKLEKEEERKFLEMGNYMDAEYLHNSLGNLIIDLQSDGINKNAKEEMIKSLKFHIEDAERALKEGKINFGSGDQYLKNHYEFIKKLTEARSFIASYKLFEDEKINEEYLADKKAIENTFFKKIEKEEKRDIRNKVILGATIASGFYAGGYALAGHFDGLGWGDKKVGAPETPEISGEGRSDGLPDKIKEASKDSRFSSPEKPVNSAASGADLSEAGNSSETEPVESSLSEIPKSNNEKLNGLYEKFKEKYEALSHIPLEENLNNKQLNSLIQEMRSDGISFREIAIFLTEVNGQNVADVNGEISNVLQGESYIGEIKGGGGYSRSENQSAVEVPATGDASETDSVVAKKEASGAAAVDVEQPESLGLKNNFILKLGEGKVPAQLERVFHMMSADSMEDVTGADNMFGEEEGAKSLNVAANLVKLAEGKDVPGVDTGTFREAVEWNPKTGELQIKDYEIFNEIARSLHGHADELWEKGVLQKGAAAYLDDIKKDTWDDIIKAEGLEKAGDIETGIEGHDDMAADKITDFENSQIVAEAEKMIPAEAPVGDKIGMESVPGTKKINSLNIVERFSGIDISNEDDAEEFLESAGFIEMTAKSQDELLDSLKEKAGELAREAEGDSDVVEEYQQTRALITFLQENHDAKYGERMELLDKLYDNYEKELKEIKELAGKVVEKKVTKIYSHGFWPFKGSQIEEWQTMQNKLAVDIKNGNFGEPLGYTIDAAETNNRLELQEYVDNAINEMKRAHISDAEPIGKETVKDFLRRYEEWRLKNDEFYKNVERIEKISRELGYMEDAESVNISDGGEHKKGMIEVPK